MIIRRSRSEQRLGMATEDRLSLLESDQDERTGIFLLKKDIN